MKTPPSTSTQSTSSTSSSQTTEKPKTESKPPQKEFKEVLHDKAEPRPKTQLPLKQQKGFKLEKMKDDRETPEHQALTSAGRKPVSAKSGHDDSESDFGSKKKELSKKDKKEDLKEFSVPNMMMMGPSTVHGKAEVQKAGGPALNIREIESIVQKVQVGINEKGLPEMNFELMTDKLGPLNLKISSENEKIRINFVTQDASAQAELERGLKDLSQLLGQKGLNLSETNVMTRDQQSQQQQQDDRGRGDSRGAIGEAGKSKAPKKVNTGRSDDGFTI
jgi:flagellar hook-length control protein FliK